MFGKYPVLIHYEAGGYWAEFPDLEGCFSQGDTLDEVLSNAEEAKNEYLSSLRDSGKNIPKPSDLSLRFA